MKRVSCFALLAAFVCGSTCLAQDQVGVWMKYEKPFESDKSYENPLYDVKEFAVRFTSPTGRVKKIHGFWDGGRDWKVRFCPDEKTYNHFISVSQADECGTIVVYVPVKSTVRLYNPLGRRYDGEWFNPVTNDHTDATIASRDGMIEAVSPLDGDLVLVLHRN